MLSLLFLMLSCMNVKKNYLVLADANDEQNILQQYECMIDIVFVNDFGVKNGLHRFLRRP